jgi:hypothetical protein
MAKRKYNNVPTVVDGRRFDSKKEAARYGELKLLQAAGQIAELACQPPFQLVVNGVKVGKYVADFVYLDCTTGELVYEDVKGVRTAVYKLKAKLVLALYGITIREI